MFITFQNIKTDRIDFDSLIDKYICFLSKDVESLKMTTGKYVTNCNYIYKVSRITGSYMFVGSNFHGVITQTKLRKDTFERDFFDGHYVISDTEPVFGIEVGTYSIDVPDYTFSSTTDLSKSFTPDEINNLLKTEFLGTTKTYDDVKNCIETLCNVVMKRHFDYINIGSSYFQYTNLIHVGLTICTGRKFIDSFGFIEVKSYRNKITEIKFEQYSGPLKPEWSTLEDLIIKYLTDNKDYIDSL